MDCNYISLGYVGYGSQKIAVQYARRNPGGFDRNITGTRQYIPLRLNASGVMPIIFAQAIMFVPTFLGGSIKNIDSQFMSTFGSWMEIEFADIFGLWYNIVFDP